jgi:hypothetical protein
MQKALLFAALAGSTVAAAPTAVQARQDDPAVQITLNKRQPFERGHRVRAFVRTEDDGYLLVLHAEPDGRIRVLFPVDPYRDDYVRGGRRNEIRGRGDREAFRVFERSGIGTVFAAFSRDPFQLGAFIREDHWDYRALDEWRLTGDRDAEAELVALAQEITGRTFFEYDVLHYGVGAEYVAHGHTHYRFSVGLGYGWPYYGYGSGWYSGARVSFGPFHVGYYTRPYRRWRSLHFCDPFVYDAWACGLAYDPYWYGRHWDPWVDWRWYALEPYRTVYYQAPRARVYYRSPRFGPTAIGYGKYAFKNDAQSGLTGGIGVRRRAPETYRVADARRRSAPTTVAPGVRTTAGRRAVDETPAQRAGATERARPQGWGMTDGRRVVPSTETPAADPTRNRAVPGRRGVDTQRPEAGGQAVDRRPTRRTGSVAPPRTRADVDAVAPRRSTEESSADRAPARTPRRVTVPGRTSPRPQATTQRAPTRSTPSVRRTPTRSTPSAQRAPARGSVSRQPARSSGSVRQSPRPSVRQPSRPTVRSSRPAVRRAPARTTTRRPRPTARRPKP